MKFSDVEANEAFEFASGIPADQRPRYTKIDATSYVDSDGLPCFVSDVDTAVMNVGHSFDDALLHQVGHGFNWRDRSGRDLLSEVSVEHVILAGYAVGRGGHTLALAGGQLNMLPPAERIGEHAYRFALAPDGQGDVDVHCDTRDYPRTMFGWSEAVRLFLDREKQPALGTLAEIEASVLVERAVERRHAPEESDEPSGFQP